MSDHFQELAALVGRVRTRWRALSALRAGTLAALASVVLLGLAVVTDLVLSPQGAPGVALWGVASVAVLGVLAWSLIPLRHKPRDLQVARLIEERCPELDDSLVTAIAERDAAGERPMTAAVVGDAVNRVRGLDIDRVVSMTALRQAGLRAAASVVALGIVGFFSVEPMDRAAAVAAQYLFPSQFAFEVLPGDVRVREGSPLRIVARIDGLAAGLVPMLRVNEGAGWIDTPMEPGQDGFSVALMRVTSDFQYLVTTGTATSREYDVTVVHPPRVQRIDLRYEYPPAFGLAPRAEEDGGDIYGPAGTKVHITVFADKPVTQASLNLTGGHPVALTARGNALEGQLTIADDGSYRVALTDADGIDNPGDTEYFIRTLLDRPPDVRIVRPAADREVSPLEEVPIEARADDDFGVQSLELVYAIRGGEERVVPFEYVGTGIAVGGRRLLYLEDLKVRPGDFISYYARARDVSRGKRSSEARSDVFFLEVTPFDAEFVRREGEGGTAEEQTLAQLVQGQKEIITATWKIDRRNRDTGAQSEADIRAIANSQRDLRALAVTVRANLQRAANVRRGRAGTAGGQQPDIALVALLGAINAMQQAQQRLTALDIPAALPPEMTALNELLRAQAENRRREIGQQQANNGSGRGQNRQGQDMSAMFDRELARQQQTRFETPNTQEARQEQGGNPNADKLRELAERQDELTREERQAGNNPGAGEPTEEQRRELERLLREQSELRRQADDLARQLQQQQGQQGGRGQQPRNEGAGTQESRDLQRVAENMQNAVSELRRGNAQRASERGAEAAEGLRDIEQQMRGSQPDDRRRAIGEMQLESRQLADAQRRLSGQGQPDGADADTRRRRAGEQTRLAERTERLEESVRQLAGGTSQGREREALNDAVEELNEARLSERMREAARQGAAPAREGQEIAKSLERLGDTLSTASGVSDEAQRLSEELAKIRELREQLADLDRQLAEVREREGERSAPDGRGRGEQQNTQGNQQWRDARELLQQLQKDADLEVDAPAANGFNPGLSAPGTEAWKQDFAAWDVLKVQMASALERAERTTAARLREQQSQDRLNAGASQSVPEQYRRLVEKYFRALASGR